MQKYAFIVVLVLQGISFTSKAADFVLDGGLHFGGDTLAIVYKNQSGNQQEIKAGQLVSVAVGARFDVSESLEMPVTFGIKFDAASFDDYYGNKVDVTFIRYPVNALLLYKAEKWRLGGGLTYHLNPEFKVKGGYYDYSKKFKDALGYLLEVRYFFSDNAYVGSRYTHIEYEVKSSSQTVDGTSVGVVLGANL